jgi:hypothetical protein
MLLSLSAKLICRAVAPVSQRRGATLQVDHAVIPSETERDETIASRRRCCRVRALWRWILGAGFWAPDLRDFSKETAMKKIILASLSAAALFGIAACSDSGTSTDTTTTQSTNPPATEPAPVDPAADPNAMKPAEPAPAPAAPAQ